MSVDGPKLTVMKNRIGKSQLNSQLDILEREQKAEMRMHNTLKQQFKAKHPKLDFYVNRDKYPANVKMYETHNPGFCYRRNGEAKPVLSSSGTPSVCYEDIHNMVFTNGELDIDKVLCLHLLTAHRTETLKPPMRNHRALSFLVNEQSPLERLIERSRKRRRDDSLTKLLPTYVLDVNGEQEERNKTDNCLIRDGRLAERIIINDKIVQLIRTVLDALQTSNPDKMNTLISKAKDETVLRELVEKPHLQDFLQTLRKQMVISSCDSFHLTQPFKTSTVQLQVKSSARSLKNLVNHIRRNVFQHPAQSTWRDMYDQSHSREEDVEEEILTGAFYDDTQEQASKFRMSKENMWNFDGVGSTTEARNDKSKIFNSRNSFSDDGKVNAKRNRVSMHEEETVLKELAPKRVVENNKTMDLNGVSVTYINKEVEADKFDVPRDLESKTTLTPATTPRIKKHPPIVTLDQVTDDNINHISVKHLSMLIDSHVKKLASEDRRASKIEKHKSPSLKSYKNLAKGSISLKGSMDAVELDLLDLAKITQEIREKETKKKLTKFLQNPV